MPKDLSVNLEKFFKNRDFVCLVDMMAKRYGKMPHEVLTECSIFEFSVNVAIMVSAHYKEAEPREQAPSSDAKTWKKFGVNREVVKKPHKKMTRKVVGNKRT